MALASILTVTLSMFILGVFLAAVLNINHMASYLENQVEMTIYLKAVSYTHLTLPTIA